MLQVIILAAGQGKRMNSALPKVLHNLAGKPLLEYVIESTRALCPEDIYVVYGFAGSQILTQFNHFPVQWIYQEQILGTGHAVRQVTRWLKDHATVLILPGDTPLITPDTLKQLLSRTSPNQLGFISSNLINPYGLGRVLRNRAGEITGIVEESDASEEQKSIREVSCGIFTVPGSLLKQCLAGLERNNVQGEYYLPDIVSLAVSLGVEIRATEALYAEEVQGVNDRLQLAHLERYQQQYQAKKLLAAGLGLMDPDRFDLRGDLRFGLDVIIDMDVIVEGQVEIGSGSYIGPYTLLRNVKLGCNVYVESHSILEDSQIGDNCIVGPFARLRPGTRLSSEVHIGNFVEIKNSRIDEQTKINHLSYVGDAFVGKRVNIGAGTITCNYDGIKKHNTHIGDEAFIGSNTALVAPITVGRNSTIGAGSTVTNNVPPESLTLSRTRQRSWHHAGKPINGTINGLKEHL